MEEQKDGVKQSEMMDSDNLEFYQDLEDSDNEEASGHNKFAQYEDSDDQGDQILDLDAAERDQNIKITDKQFYKEMQKLKDRGTSAVPPKKSASAYIIFCQKVSWLPPNTSFSHSVETRRNS